MQGRKHPYFLVACEVSTFCIDYDVWIWKEVFFARTDKSVSLFSLKLFFVAHISSKMLCINCKQTKLPADSHVLCFRCCGFSQLSPCARSANWALEILEELSHFPSYVSSGRGQAQGFPSSTLVNNFQLNSEPAPDLENRRRGPQVAVTVTSNECLTRGPRPAPSDASRRKATQGALANPCSGGNSEPRYLSGYRTPYRYVSSAAFNTAG